MNIKVVSKPPRNKGARRTQETALTATQIQNIASLAKRLGFSGAGAFDHVTQQFAEAAARSPETIAAAIKEALAS